MFARLITSAKFAFALPIILLLVNFVVVYSWNPDFAYLLSAPFHFLGGAAMAILFFYFFEKDRQFYSFKKSVLVSLVLVLGFVALAGVLWEFFEFSLDKIFPQAAVIRPAQPNLDDTMADLFWDLIGGLVIAATYFKSSLYKIPETRM